MNKTNDRQSKVCPPVLRDNKRALARGLSTIQADEACLFNLQHDTPTADLACNMIVRAKNLGIW